MTDEFDALVEELQERVFDEAKEAYGEAGFQRWRRPLYNGRLEPSDGHARVTGICGDTMEIFLKFEDDRVKEASYITDGCGSSTICGSFAVELAIGKDPDEVAAITGEAVVEKIGRLPKEDEHCAFLAAETLREALAGYMKQRTRHETRIVG